MIEALLECRATLDQRDSSGATPLHFAAMNAKVEVVKLLMDRGWQFFGGLAQIL